MSSSVSVRRPAWGRGDLLCLIAILALSTLFLAPALRPGYTLLPLGLESGIAPWHKQVTERAKNLLLSDPFYTFYPRRHFFTNSLRHGVYPLWNPTIFGGHPVVGDTAAQTFYPPNLVTAMLLPAARALPVLAWFHLTLTGSSMFAFLRLLRLRPGAALFGATAWMLNGNTVVWLENPHRLSTLAWMPAVFLCYELALKRRRAWTVVSGFLYGLAISGGHTQLAMTLGMSLAAYALFRTIVISRTARRVRLHPLLTAAAVGLMGIGVGAVQLLPTLQLAGMSHRRPIEVAHFLSSRWPYEHVVGLWIPDFFGNPVRFPYWGARNYAEVTAYYGAFAFPISLATLVWSRRSEGQFFPAALLAVLLIALGTPLAWLVAWLPWVRYFRLISLIAYLPFFGAAAAAFGLEAVGAARDPAWKVAATYLLVLIGLVAITVVVATDNATQILDRWTEINPLLKRTGAIWLVGLGILLLVRRWPALTTAPLVLLVAIDLIQWGAPFNPVNSLDILYPENEVTAWLRQDPSLYRVLPLQTDRAVFGPNVLSVLGFQETGGYSSLMIERYRELVKAIDREVAIWWMRPNQNMLVNSRFDPLFSLLNVKYVLASHQLTDQPMVSVEASFSGCVEPGLILAAGDRITQTFRALHPGLNRVDIAFVRSDEPTAQSVRFLLWREREAGELVADVSADGAALSKDGLLVSFFAPVPDSAGRPFVWALETEGEGQIGVCQAEGEPPGQPAFQAYSTQLQMADIRQGVWIYENPNVLPRAYVVHHVEVEPDERLLERLTSPDFNVWTTALTEEPLSPEQMTSLEGAPSHSTSTTQIVHYGLHRVEVEANMTAPGLLILSDAYYPGWKVTVDGAPAPLLRANYALRGVYLPTGTHSLVFRFSPTSFWIGLGVTSLVTVLGLGFLVWQSLKKWRHPTVIEAALICLLV